MIDAEVAVMKPVALVIGESICTPASLPSPVPVIVTVAPLVALIASVTPETISTPSPAVPPPAVVPVIEIAPPEDAICAVEPVTSTPSLVAPLFPVVVPLIVIVAAPVDVTSAAAASP